MLTPYGTPSNSGSNKRQGDIGRGLDHERGRHCRKQSPEPGGGSAGDEYRSESSTPDDDDANRRPGEPAENRPRIVASRQIGEEPCSPHHNRRQGSKRDDRKNAQERGHRDFDRWRKPDPLMLSRYGKQRQDGDRHRVMESVASRDEAKAHRNCGAA